MTRPRVSVVIANWNGANHLPICIPSLQSQSFTSLEIIIVDNGSSDRSAEVAQSFGVRWFPLKSNLGLAPALNRGAEIALGDLLLFVNNDMRFDPKFVEELVGPLDRGTTIFATDGMQFNWDGTFRGHMAARLSTVDPRSDTSSELVPGLYFQQQDRTEETSVFMASAACMMVKNDLFKKLGGFDDRLPLRYEDVEICWRAWVCGWKTVYVPRAICWHRIGASGKSEAGARFNFRGVLRGRLLLATKLLPTGYALRTWLISVLGLGKDVSQLRWKFAKDRIRVLAQTAALTPQLLQERKELFCGVSNSPEQQLAFLLRLTEETRVGH